MADIKRQKLSLEQSVKSMQANADVYLTLAEENNDISYLVKANTFRKTVLEKEDSLKDLDQAIGTLECDWKNLKLYMIQLIIWLVGQLAKTCLKLAV